MNKKIIGIKEFLFMISILILTIGILWQAKISEKNVVSVPEQVQNMLVAPPIGANTYLEDYSLYVPQGFKFKIVDNTIVVYNKQTIITFYLGQGVQLEKAFLDSMNPNLEKLYGQSASVDGVTTYTYAWKYDEDNVEFLLGQNDSYIVCVTPNNKLDESIVDITLMFNSYQSIHDK